MIKNIDIILSSLSINRPILQSMHLEFQKTIFLTITESENVYKIVEKLSPCPVLINSALSVEQTIQRLRFVTSEAVIVMPAFKKLRENKKMLEKIQLVSEGEKNSSSGTRYQGFLIGTFLENDLREKFFEIPYAEFPETLTGEVNVVPSREELGIIRDVIENFEDMEEIRLSLYSAVAFTYPDLKRQNRMSDFKSLLSTADKLFDFWKEDSDIFSTATILGAMIFDAVKSGTFEIAKIENAPASLKNVLLFDAATESLCMKSEVFREILRPFLNNVPFSEAKRFLVKAGYLVPGTDGSLTKKIWIKQGECIERKNLVRLNVGSISRNVGMDNIKLAAYLKNK